MSDIKGLNLTVQDLPTTITVKKGESTSLEEIKTTLVNEILYNSRYYEDCSVGDQDIVVDTKEDNQEAVVFEVSKKAS